MRGMWPGICGNSAGSTTAVSRMRKRAVQVSRFMLQMIQCPLFSKESEEQHSSKSSDSVLTSTQSLENFDSGEEGLAIRIAAEVLSFILLDLNSILFPTKCFILPWLSMKNGAYFGCMNSCSAYLFFLLIGPVVIN